MLLELEQICSKTCDRCNQPVEPHNNAVYWQIAYDALKEGLEPLQALQLFVKTSKTISPRHFNSVKGCEGSPSRRSFAIEGAFSFLNCRRLLPQEYIVASHEESQKALDAYLFMQRLSDL